MEMVAPWIRISYQIHIKESKAFQQGSNQHAQKAIIPVPDAIKLRISGVYMECDNMREVLPKV